MKNCHSTIQHFKEIFRKNKKKKTENAQCTTQMLLTITDDDRLCLLRGVPIKQLCFETF